jgi:hypothetical protein
VAFSVEDAARDVVALRGKRPLHRGNSVCVILKFGGLVLATARVKMLTAWFSFMVELKF